MGQFQQVMQHFLETQRAVMLTYLGQPVPPGLIPNRIALGDTNNRAHPAVGGPAIPPSPTVLPVAGPSEPPVVTAIDSTAGVEADDATAPARSASQISRPAAAPVPPPTQANGHADHPSREQLTERLLALVSERTGYPLEMLALNADLEADLGIDSIKRVEIAGSMLKALPTVKPDDVEMERLTGSRTLHQVLEVLEALARPAMPALAASGEERRPFEVAAGTDPRIGRFLVRPIHVPAARKTGGLADGVVVIIDDATGIGAALAARLDRAGKQTVRIVGAGADQGSGIVAADPSTPEGARRLIALLHEQYGPASALIHLGALRSGEREIGLELDRWRERLDDGLISLFLLSKALQSDLERAASQGGAVVLGATALGGAFALDPTPDAFSATDGGITGFLKTLAQEWPTVRVKAVDIASAPADEVAEWLFNELQTADERVEVGYRNGQRAALELIRAPTSGSGDGQIGQDAPSAEVIAPDPLDGESVLLVTGGARGITAEVALALAEAYHPRLILIGRTPLPQGQEAPFTAGRTDPREIRRAILEQRRLAGQPISPAAIEEEFRSLLRQREVRDNLARLEQTGSRVDYVSVDVSDAAALARAIDEIYQSYGRIDGVIHGAGVIEDKLIRDKELPSFQRVVATKVHSAVTLAKHLRPDSLKFLVLFSSVSGRFGNRGQGDYAAASEMLNKLAQWLNCRWPARVVSINWGPWLKTGMVSAEVQRQFAERGVALIPPEEGCHRLDAELRWGRKGDVEVLIGGGISSTASINAPHPGDALGQELMHEPPSAAAPSPRIGAFALLRANSTATRIEGGLDVRRRFDLEQDLYLHDHQLDGHPVLPFAVAMELMAEVAAAGWPEFEVAEVQNIRVLRGITFDQGARSVRVLARSIDGSSGEARSRSSARIDVQITPDDGSARVFYRATVELRAPGPANPPRFAPDQTALAGARPLPVRIAEAYRAWLFHGPLFQHLESVEAIGPGGARATIRRSRPSDCLRDASSAAWLIDPIVIDSAFQLQVIWARLHWEVTLLPASVGACRWFAPFPVPGTARSSATAETIYHEMRIRPESKLPLCHVDHFFYKADGRLLGALTDVEGVGTRALNRLASGGSPVDGRAHEARS